MMYLSTSGTLQSEIRTVRAKNWEEYAKMRNDEKPTTTLEPTLKWTPEPDQTRSNPIKPAMTLAKS